MERGDTSPPGRATTSANSGLSHLASLSSPESSENSTSNHLTSTKDIEVDIEVIIPVAFVPLCQVSITTGRSYFDSGVTVRKKAQVGPK